MKRTSKPVRNCHGCGLNLGDHCALYDSPHEMWRRRKCPGFGNEELLREYEENQARHEERQAKQKRREVARERDTEDHHQGTRHRNGTMATK